MRRRHTPKEENLLKKWKKLIERVSPDWLRPISRKKHPLDCGQPGCPLCHSDKLDGRESTKQEKSADLKLQEQSDEELPIWPDE